MSRRNDRIRARVTARLPAAAAVALCCVWIGSAASAFSPFSAFSAASGPDAFATTPLALSGIPGSAVGTAVVEHDQPQIRARLLVDSTVSPLRAGVLFDLAPGWHLYWRNPGGTGLPPRIEFTLPGHEAGEIEWPAPHTFEEADGLFTTWGYEQAVLLTAPLMAATGEANTTAGAHATAEPMAVPGAKAALEANGVLEAKVSALVCRTQCVPIEFDLATPLDANPTDTDRESIAALFRAERSRVPISSGDAGFRVTARWRDANDPEVDTPGVIEVLVDACSHEAGTCSTLHAVRGQALFVPMQQDALELSPARPLEPGERAGTIAIEVPALRVETGDDRLRGLIPVRQANGRVVHVEIDVEIGDAIGAGESMAAVTPAAGQTALPQNPTAALPEPVVSPSPNPAATTPATRSSPTTPTAPTASATPATLATRPATPPGTPATNEVAKTLVRGAGASTTLAGWLRILGLALLGGLILNGMPCVLPVLAIKVVAVAGLAEKDPREVRWHGLAYTGGVLASMLVLAGVVTGLRAAGHAVGWGFQFQEPLFVAAIAAILVTFAMNLFGVFEIELGQGRLASVGQDATGVRRSAFEGLLAVVLATPCTAPFLGTAVGFAFASNGAAIAAIFVAIGLGLASPFLWVSFQPSAARFIPRSGPWMNTLRSALGFSLLATVLWLLWVLGQSGGVEAVVSTTGVLLALSFLLFCFGQLQPIRSVWIGRLGVLAIAAIAATGFNLIEFDRVDETRDTVLERDVQADPWQPYSEAAVAESVGAGHPAFVIFTADWCITCKMNERTVLEREAVESALARHGYALFKADWTRPNDRIRDKLAEFGRAGVPLYLVYAPGQPNAPRVLSELLSIDEVVTALAENGAPKAS